MEEIVKQAECLWNYYWSHGADVEEEHRLPAAWVFQVHEALSKTRRLRQASGRRPRSLGVWGASQSGKSTLLGTQLDPAPGQAPDGHDGPLSWGSEKGQYALFNKASQKGEEASALHINPFNGGLDASGCVTRFRVVNRTPTYIDFPQEVVLLDERQILETLAAGYSSEAQNPPPVTIASIKEILNTFTGPNQGMRLHKEAFLRTMAVFETVRTFSDMRLERYGTLTNASAELSQLLFPTAGSRLWLCDLETATRLAQKVLWGDCGWVNNLFEEMKDTLSVYADQHIYCSLSVASYLLDAQLDPNEGKVLQWRDDHAKKTFLGTDARHGPPRAGPPLAGPEPVSAEYLQRIQGVVKEVLVPVNGSHLRPGALDVEGVDVVDIPGVPQQGLGGQAATALDREKIRWPRDRAIVYRQLVKRGKTLSTVFGLIRELGLDAVLLVVRQGAGAPIALPNMLRQPIRYWLHRPEQSRRLPLRIGVSFFAECMQSWQPGEAINLNWSATFAGPLGFDTDERLAGAKAQPFSCPRWQTEELMRFNGKGTCKNAAPLDKRSQEELLKAFRESGDWKKYGFVQDRNFVDQVLRAAFDQEHGGTQGLLREAARLALADYEVSDDTRRDSLKELDKLIADALADVPPAWVQSITTRLQALEPAAFVGRYAAVADERASTAYAVRKLLSIRPEDLEDPKLSMRYDGTGVSLDPGYVAEQYDRVAASLPPADGFGNDNLFRRLLGLEQFVDGPRNLRTALAKGVDVKAVETKLEDMFRDENKGQHKASWYAWGELRPSVRQRLVALVLEWGLWLQLPGHPAAGTHDHYWDGVLEPLYGFLSRYTTRTPQGGDNELRDIQQEVERLLASYR